MILFYSSNQRKTEVRDNEHGPKPTALDIKLVKRLDISKKRDYALNRRRKTRAGLLPVSQGLAAMGMTVMKMVAKM